MLEHTHCIVTVLQRRCPSGVGTVVRQAGQALDSLGCSIQGRLGVRETGLKPNLVSAGGSADLSGAKVLFETSSSLLLDVRGSKPKLAQTAFIPCLSNKVT